MNFDKNMLPKPAIMNPNYISLPSEWDSSVSQIEMLQRMLWNLNQVIQSIGALAADQADVDNKLNQLMNNMYDFMLKWVDEYFKFHGVFFGLTDDGYFVAYIPDGWDDIIFNTTEYDIFISGFSEYGHLVLSY